MTSASVLSDFAAARRLPGDARSMRMRGATLAAAIALHAGLGALFVFAVPWQAPEPESVVYDLVFVEPSPPPQPAATPPSVETAAVDEPAPPSQIAEPVPTAAPVMPTIAPKPVVKPVRPHRVHAPPQQTVVAPSPPPSSGTSPVAAPEVAAVPPRPPQEAAPHPAPDPVYAASLLSWLDRHKEYPWVARRRGMQGRVVLRLAVARNGKVAESAIETSSGTEILDRAALDMVHRADPLPPLPSSFPGTLAEFRVPIEFALAQP